MPVDRRLFVALLALPNLAAAFSSAGLLFLPGATAGDQRLVSSMGSDATATTWAVTCTQNLSATTPCDIPSPYAVYTIGPSTMKNGNAVTAPDYDIECTLTPNVAGTCSGHVTGIAFQTAINAAYLATYGYRQVIFTDSFPASTTSSIPSSTTSSPTTSSAASSGSKTTSSVTAHTSINSSGLNSYSNSEGSASPTSAAKQSANGGLGGGGVAATSTSKKNAAASMPTGMNMMGEMGMMAAVAVVGGAVGF